MVQQKGLFYLGSFLVISLTSCGSGIHVESDVWGESRGSEVIEGSIEGSFDKEISSFVESVDGYLSSDSEIFDTSPCVPQGEEICDGIDNDCDGEVDEEWGEVPPGFICKNLGVCKDYVVVCKNGKWVCVYGQDYEEEETRCDELDNDCDGETDEGIINCCEPGETKVCGTDIGECEFGKMICGANGMWSKCEGGIKPSTEVCDNKDNDCDGETDNNAQDCIIYYADRDNDGYVVVSDFACLCAPTFPYGKTEVTANDCNDNDKLIYPGGQPACQDSCSDGVVTEKEECDDGNVIVEDGCDGCLFSYFPAVTYIFPSEMPPAVSYYGELQLGGKKSISFIEYPHGGARYALVWLKFEKEGESHYPTFYLQPLDENLKPLSGEAGKIKEFKVSKPMLSVYRFTVKYHEGKIYFAWGNPSAIYLDIFDAKEEKLLNYFVIDAKVPLYCLHLMGFEENFVDFEIFPLVENRIFLRLRVPSSWFEEDLPLRHQGLIVESDGSINQEFLCKENKIQEEGKKNHPELKFIFDQPYNFYILPDFYGNDLMYAMFSLESVPHEEEKKWDSATEMYVVRYDIKSGKKLSEFGWRKEFEESFSGPLIDVIAPIIRSGTNVILVTSYYGEVLPFVEMFIEVYDEKGTPILEKTKIGDIDYSGLTQQWRTFYSFSYPPNKFAIAWQRKNISEIFFYRRNFLLGIERNLAFPILEGTEDLFGGPYQWIEKSLVVLNESTLVLVQAAINRNQSMYSPSPPPPPDVISKVSFTKIKF